MEYKVQVEQDRYTNENYLGIAWFLSYREQVLNVLRLKDVQTVCEIGIGNGIAAAILRNFNYQVTTVDFDERLKPDRLCSILDLKKTIDERFDMVLCFEVLEHLQFSEFELGLQNLAAISKKYVFLSLPYVGFTLKAHFYASHYGERQLTFVKRLPSFWQTHTFDGEHYWEIGKREYSRRKIRDIILKHLTIKREWLFPYNHSTLYFLCEVRNEN